MGKKKQISEQGELDTPSHDTQALGAYLAAIRTVRRLTLRAVEEASGGEVSNAYLSQIENHKISRPSPNVLHALAKVLVVPYETLMEKAGYLTPAVAAVDTLRSATVVKPSKQSVFASETLTPEEEEAMLDYLAFLRSKKAKS